MVDSVLHPTVRRLCQFKPHKLVEDKNEREEQWGDYCIEHQSDDIIKIKFLK